jgi:uncharacterized repeat protein (TIGR03803 family)
MSKNFIQLTFPVLSSSLLSSSLFVLSVIVSFSYPRLAAKQGNRPATFSSTETVLHSFNGSDGTQPYAGLLFANDGKYYGTTAAGKTAGTIFSIDPSGNFSLLYSFPGGSGGATPNGALIQGGDGDFYGTTTLGGNANGGIIFRMMPGQTPVVIHQFNLSTDGGQPFDRLLPAKDGFLYGTTYTDGPHGGGTIFRIATDGSQYDVIYAFPANATDGANPKAGLIQGSDGMLYGTTTQGGSSNQGTVFGISTAGKLTILHSFTGGSDGGLPVSSLTQLGNDNFYGTTTIGGSGAGTIFKMDYVHVFTVRHVFNSAKEGGTCVSGLYLGGNGSLYGVTSTGGTGGYGSLFAINTNFEDLTIIEQFGSPSNGFDATGLPFQASDGSLYGTAQMGGADDDGVIYRIVPGSVTPRWTTVGPVSISVAGSPPAAGKLQAIAVDTQNPAVIFSGGGIGPGNAGPYSQAGIYITSDGGTTWTQADTGLSDTVANTLWLDPSDSATVLAGTNSSGIFQSTDAGAHWNLQAHTGATTAFVQVGNNLYAATALGIEKSTKGADWTLYRSTPTPILALAASGGVLYAGLADGQVLIQKIPDAVAARISTPASGAVWSIAINPANPNNAFVVEWNNYESPDLYVTNDLGQHWSTVNINCPVQTVAYSVVTSTLYAGCDGVLYQSPDNGGTWNQVSGAVWDVRQILPDFGGVTGSLAIGSEQGVFLGNNQGSTWQSLNGNIAASVTLGVAVVGNFILTVAEDLGPLTARHAGEIWSSLNSSYPPGEGGVGIYNPVNIEYGYFFTPVNGLQYSINNGKAFQSATGLPGSEFPTYAGNGDLLAGDLQNPSNVYAAGVDGIFKSTDWGITWALQAWPISTPVMVGVDPSNSATIFVGQQNGQLLVSHDGGNTFAQTKLACSNCGWPVSVTVEPSNSQLVLIGMSQPPPNGGILVSIDGGANFVPSNSGIKPSTNLCQTAAVPRVRFDPSGAPIMAAATNSGLYVSSDLGSSWSNVQNNVVPSIFTGVEWASGDLWASTCGEGIVRTPFAQ